MGFSLIYTPVLHYDDINGRPLVGGKLYTYKSGTNTPAPTYRNKNGTELNENPIPLNERGECVCFLEEGMDYKFVLKDKLDAVIWEQDDVSVPEGNGGGFAQVQSNWNESDTSSPAFIRNKPTITDDVYLAEYGVATVSEISAAKNAGKEVYTLIPGTYYSTVAYLREVTRNGASANFASVTSDGASVKTATVDRSGNWSNSTVNLATVSNSSLVQKLNYGDIQPSRVATLTIDSDDPEGYAQVKADGATKGYLVQGPYKYLLDSGINNGSGVGDANTPVFIDSNGTFQSCNSPTPGLELLDIENVVYDSDGVKSLSIENGKAYNVSVDEVNVTVQLGTLSEDTVHTIICFNTDSHNTCSVVNITWFDEALVTHEIQLSLELANNEFYLDLLIRKVTVENYDYSIARVYEIPHGYR